MESKWPVEWKVQHGDTLYRIISSAYKTYNEDLITLVRKANGMTSSFIFPDQTLILPNPKPEGTPISFWTLPERIVRQIVQKIEVSQTPTAFGEPKILDKDIPTGDYYQKIYEKKKVVLHFTAGYNWTSAYNTFLKPGRVATPFIVDVGGPYFIIRLFDPKQWSYHLGVKGSRGKYDKESIGIEIVNIGPVWKKGGKWKDYVGRTWASSQVVAGTNRDADGCVAFPKEQFEATCALCNKLFEEFKIPRLVPSNKTAFQLDKIDEFRGLTTHQMYRRDKYDLGTAWPWPRMIELCGLKEVNL